MNVSQPSDSISAIKGGGRNVQDFRQPLVTYQENELILAEAYSQTGNDPVALTHLNNARAVAPLPALVAITGTALRDSIMIEKYVALFQNIEVWSDYRRTCVPALTPYLKANPIWRGKIPARLYYGGTEDLARYIGPDVRVVRGRFQSTSERGLTVSVSQVELRRGDVLSWQGETVVVPRAFVASLEERRVSRGRIVLLAGGSILALLA